MLEGQLGFKGERGDSAYEIAVKHGYTGTEEQWSDDFLNADNYYDKTEMDTIIENHSKDLGLELNSKSMSRDVTYDGTTERNLTLNYLDWGTDLAVLTGEITTTASTPDELQININYPSGFSSINCVVIGGCLGSMPIPVAKQLQNDSIYAVIPVLGDENIILNWYNPDKGITIDYKIVLMKV